MIPKLEMLNPKGTLFEYKARGTLWGTISWDHFVSKEGGEI